MGWLFQGSHEYNLSKTLPVNSSDLAYSYQNLGVGVMFADRLLVH